ncbi:hypothetical protein DFA_10545 [Cavenderia fasciculata]|uniref:UDENN domain-containing protein n=1 Tax=Cavenderia fasciculata TaxID=261658 RepID=F4QAI4_CACFS|nr:uncharacterized protein DFA_10545 [Cavenderia fasciculata]EGG15703.1 hypothetical protein DFA_10545 [Cavenderia fasciculata]|eukprot:XP_004354445.1 hypothetical protein DFA_10545 [Cavenderia fasciculata]
MMMMDPLSILAAEEEEKQNKILEKEKEVEEQKRSTQVNHAKIFAEEERKLESIATIHLHHPSIHVGMNDNIKTIEINDRSLITKKKWMNAFCIVNFDLEIGQTLDYSFPPKLNLKEEEIVNLCFLSFPDSNSHLQGDIIYCFKLKYWNQETRLYDYQYGYVFFRQEKNDRIERGYLQRSVVLLSDEPFVGLYKKVIEVVGPLYFQFGETLLEVAFQNMSNWPELKLGQSYELPILGSIFTFHVPYTIGAPHIIDPILKYSNNTNFQSSVMGSGGAGGGGNGNASTGLSPPLVSVSNLKSIDLYCCFKNLSTKLWMLWEMVLLNHPIIVMSPSPPISSDCVLALISLISPLNYTGDYRPYFTIHDPDFQKFTATNSTFHKHSSSNNNNNTTSSSSEEVDCAELHNNINGTPSTILGVTNPFFLKALGHWPTTVIIGPTQRFGKSVESSASSMKKTLSFSRDSDAKERVVSEYKPLTSPDKTILKKISSGDLENNNNNESLRKHFLQLTLNFLIPLERYFASLLPLAKTISVFQRPPRLKDFDQEEFLNKLEGDDETYVIDSKTKEIELYKKFLESSNFENWLENKRKEAIRHLNILYRKAILEADVQTLLKGKSPATALDLYKRIKDQLILEENLFNTSHEIKEKIKSHLELIVPYLPLTWQAN